MANVTIRRRADSVAVSRGQLGLTDDPDQLIVAGDTVEVPAEFAGQPPAWRILDDGEARVPFRGASTLRTPDVSTHRSFPSSNRTRVTPVIRSPCHAMATPSMRGWKLPEMGHPNVTGIGSGR